MAILRAIVESFKQRERGEGAANERRRDKRHLRQLMGGTPGAHFKCLTSHPQLPRRAAVPEAKIDWAVDWPTYQPTAYEAEIVLSNNRDKVPQEDKPKKGWADPPDFAQLREELLARTSFEGRIKLGSDGAPVNPRGRTGMKGRGLLGKWGPNHAADPIVTRFHPETGSVQFVAIQRVDTGDWAIPGGMVDAGETVSETVRREFEEEAVNITDPGKAETFKNRLNQLFSESSDKVVVYQGMLTLPHHLPHHLPARLVPHAHVLAPGTRHALGTTRFSLTFLGV
jgi:ADP-ribose pyrophosphatase